MISQGTQLAAAASSGLEQCLEGKMGKKIDWDDGVWTSPSSSSAWFVVEMS